MSVEIARTDGRLAELARSQGGAFTRSQALDAGFSKRLIEHRLSAELWTPIHPRVYRATSTPMTAVTTGHAARLYVGEPAAYSHLTAARLLGLDPKASSSATWLAIPHPRRVARPPDLRIQRTRHFDGWLSEASGLPVTTPARTVVDLAGVLDETALRRLMYECARTGAVSATTVLAAADVLGSRAGLARIRHVLRQFDPAYEAETEERARLLLRRAGLELEPQIEVWSDFGLVARIDLGDEDLLLGIEIDGEVGHSSREAVAYDKRRDRALGRLGWHIARFTVREVRDHPKQFVREVSALVARRQRRAS